jgi:hypothetical protein
LPGLRLPRTGGRDFVLLRRTEKPGASNRKSFLSCGGDGAPSPHGAWAPAERHVSAARVSPARVAPTELAQPWPSLGVVDQHTPRRTPFVSEAFHITEAVDKRKLPLTQSSRGRRGARGSDSAFAPALR